MKKIETLFNLARSCNALVSDIHMLSIEKGWWETNRSMLETITMIMSEMYGETIEIMRDPETCELPSIKIPGFLHLEEEWADIWVRCADMAGRNMLPLGSYIAYTTWTEMPFPEFHIEVEKESLDISEFPGALTAYLEENDLSNFIATNFYTELDRSEPPPNNVELIGSFIDNFYRLKKNSMTNEKHCMGRELKAISIKMFAIAQHNNWRMGEAILAKHEHNHTRSKRHGNRVY